MSHRIACYTLFDITKTGVLNRARPADDITDIDEWFKKRNTQSNFDTIIQIISLRAQPDVLTDPKKDTIKDHKNFKFGTKYYLIKLPYWTFDFEVQHASVFEDSLNELGSLYNDCQDVPMVTCEKHHPSIGLKLDTIDFSRNIYFVKY